jgi:hypothetical protein
MFSTTTLEKQLKKFEKQERRLSFKMFLELDKEYTSEAYERNTSYDDYVRLLSFLIIQYLFGHDLEKEYEKLKRQQKVFFEGFFKNNLFYDSVDRFLRNHPFNRKLIVYTNALTIILGEQVLGETFLNLEGIQLKNKIVEKYKEDLVIDASTVNFTNYNSLYDEYFKNLK